MVVVYTAAYGQVQRLSDFAVRKLCTVMDVFLSLVLSERKMDLLVEVCI